MGWKGRTAKASQTGLHCFSVLPLPSCQANGAVRVSRKMAISSHFLQGICTKWHFLVSGVPRHVCCIVLRNADPLLWAALSAGMIWSLFLWLVIACSPLHPLTDFTMPPCSVWNACNVSDYLESHLLKVCELCLGRSYFCFFNQFFF